MSAKNGAGGHGTTAGACPPLPARWWRVEKHLRAELERHGSLAAAARAHGVRPNTVSKAWSELALEPLPRGPRVNLRGTPAKAEPPKLEVKGDVAELVTEPTPYKLGDMDGLLRDRGLDPEEWLVDRAVVNEWDAYAGRDEGTNEPRVVKLRQLKVTLKRRVPIAWLFPASPLPARKPTPARVKRAKAELVVVAGDQQASYHDEQLHQAFTRWLEQVKPDRGVLTGDTIDLPTISRHPDRPHWNASVQECIDTGYRLLSEYVAASPSTSWRKLRGNHDWRLESELLSRAERMFGLKPADIPGTEQVPGYSVRNLLHLDALGIELVGREGDKWELAELELAPGVTVRHKPPSREKAVRMGRTVLAGDSHRQSLKRVTLWDGGRARTIALVEVGCLCSVDGLGYTEHADWQQGFATVTLTEHGEHVELATWNGRELVWRGQRW